MSTAVAQHTRTELAKVRDRILDLRSPNLAGRALDDLLALYEEHSRLTAILKGELA